MARDTPETISVLFTDLVGSTAWRVKVGEDTADLRTAELEHASREIVSSAGGTVVKSVGDGVMVTCTSAVTALDVAVRLQAVARRLAVGGSESCLRVGVSTGDMVRIGDDWLGSAAIEASRLCLDAQGGGILVADVTVRVARGRTSHQLRRLGERTLRGFVDPIDVFELVVPSDPLASLPSALERVTGDPFVGRQRERRRAESLLNAVRDGETTTVLVVGEAGVGKTCLASAIATDAMSTGFTVLYGRCDEGVAAPYQPITDALAPLVLDTPAVAIERIFGAGIDVVEQLWPELQWPGEHARPLVVDPEGQRWRLFEAISSLIRSIADIRPLLLVVDDLHWAAPSTRQLLGHVVRSAPPNVLVLATIRPEEHRNNTDDALGPGPTGSRLEVLEVGGLTTTDVSHLVALHSGET